MRIAEEAPGRLVLHESPWGVRAAGVLLAALGASVLLMVVAGGHGGGPADGNVWVAYVVGGVFVAGGVAAALTAADYRLEFDAAAATVHMIRRGALGITRAEYPFASIRDIGLEVSAMGRGSRLSGLYRSVFVLRDGTRVPWTGAATGDLGSQARCVARARTFGGWDHRASDRSPASPPAVAAVPALAATNPMIPPTTTRPTPLTAMPATSYPGEPPRFGRPPRMQNARLVGVVLGAFALVGVVMMAVEAERLIRWRPVPAVVQASAVQAVRGNKGSTSFRPVVTYAYAVRGQRYTSTQVNVLAVSNSYGWAQSMSTRFVPGAPTTAYVSPDDPANAYLVHEISLLPLCITLIPAVFGGVFLLTTRWNDRQSELAWGVNVPILAAPGAPGDVLPSPG
jgi:Protein of unknown function (DUF3592)